MAEFLMTVFTSTVSKKINLSTFVSVFLSFEFTYLINIQAIIISYIIIILFA